MKKPNKYVEKRRQPRIKKCISFEIKTNGSTITAESIDLSCIGVNCRVNKYIHVMTNLKIILALPSGDQEKEAEYVECNGVVVRVDKTSSKADVGNIYNMAIYFNEISESVKEKIVNFLKKSSGHS
ncbi:MAG: PilZ domain-containing protein [Candidatus Scalindua sediminis]